MEVFLDVLLDVERTEAVSCLGENFTERVFNPLLPVAQEDDPFPGVEDVEGRANHPQEPRPRRVVFALGDPDRNWEDLTIPVECCHDKKSAAVWSLDVTCIQSDDLRRVRKCVDANPRAQERPLEHALI